ncbi:MBG domain-containing protein [Collinsella sp. Sow4_E3]|uniref:MBG domain-containing protein n=1 Tax=Collinsella sp. Sow4_E3 TaxID=3438776 RepID=UPI003F8D9A99
MRGKKMGMRRLAACVLAAALALGGVATTLATPTVAEAYPSAAIKPKHLKSELSYGESDVIQLSGGKDYRFAGTVDIDHYEVEGGTKENPTRLYFTDSSSLGGPLTVERDLTYSQHPLFVLKGGYVEFIGDSGVPTEVRCDGKTFLSDSNDYEARGGVDKPNTGKSLNLSVENLKLVSRTENKDTDRAITLYGTMGAGETASFTNVSVSGWKCCKNSAFKVDKGNEIYEASPAPVTIRGSQVAVDATFVNCTFKNNSDDCVGALSVVGRSKTPKVTLNGCTFENNSQGMIACDEMKVESGHVHAGNIGVKNAIVALNNCSIRSTNNTSWNGPCSYMFNVWGIQYQMHMTSAIAVAKDASCTINGTVIDDSFVFPSDRFNGRDISGQDEKRCAVYALGSVTLAGNTKVTTAKAKGVDASDVASDVGSYGKVHVDESFTGTAVLSIDDTKFDPESNKQYYYYEYVDLVTSDLSQEDLASRLKLANENLAYDVTDGKVKVIHRKHEHEWTYSTNKDGYSIAATCNGQYEASHCVYSRDGETISLMSSKSGDLSFTYNGKQRDAVLATTKPSQKDNAVAQGKVTIVSARFYRCADENDTVGIEMEGSQPCDAGTYRVVATVAIEGQSDVTLERVFKINPASLAEKDSNRKDLCKVEIIGYDKLKDNVRFSNGDVLNDVPSYEWTGEEITPRIKVTYKLGDEWIVLKEGVDFERLAWGESVSEKDPGAYRSQLWGLGNFASYEQIYSYKFFYWSIYGTQFENVQAKGYSGTYDGMAHSPSVTVDNAPEGMQIKYSVDGGSLYEDQIPSYTNVTRDIYYNVCAETIKYRITAPDYVPVEGELEIKIAPADQAAPKDVKTTAATGHALADGSIDGVDNTYEWKAEAASDYQWIAEGETSVKGLAAGKYSVRLKADRNHNASKALTVEVKDGPKKADGSGWKHDDTEHWNTCTCRKEDVDRAKHDFEWVIDQAATADKPGSKHEHCKTCGYECKFIEIPAFGITGYSGIYDGEKHGVTVNAETVASIQYREKGEKKWSDESPLICDTGSKTVEFKAALTSGDTCEGEVELKVDPRPVTVKPKDASKVYGYDDPDFELEAVEGSIIKGHPLSWFKIRREAGENVGTYTLTIEESEVGDKWDKIQRANYAPTLQTGTFEITKRKLGVGWKIGTYVYDGKPQGPEIVISHVVKGDEGKVYYATEGATAVDAGNYKAKVTGLAGDPEVIKNYVLPDKFLETGYTIYKAEQEKPQGLKATAETIRGKCDGKIEGARGHVAYRLFRTQAGDANGETMVSEDGKIENLAAGDYQVWYAETDNYKPSTPVEVHVGQGKYLSVTPSDKNDTYSIAWHSPNEYLQWHASVEFSVKISDGYYAGDDFAVKANGVVLEKGEDGKYVLSNVEEKTIITVEGVRKHEAVSDTWISNDNTHWHECTCGGKIDEAAHTFKWFVDKNPTATEAGSKHQQCTVCGHALPAVEIPAAAIVGYSGEYNGAYHTVDAKSLPEGATAQYSTDGKNWSPEAPKIRDAGKLTVFYQVTIDGAKAEGEVTLEVKPRAITIAADDSSKTYGDVDPVFTWAITSGKLVEGESLEGITVKRDAGEDVREGGYALNVTQAKDANPNYDVACEAGVFTINRRPLTVTWGTSEFVYDGEEHCPEAKLGNVIGKDELGATVEGSQTEAGASYTATLTVLTGKAAGNYVLPPEGLTCDFSIKNAAQDAPKVQAEAETVSGRRDGKIAGVNATMEWRAKGAAEYQAVGEGVTELKDLAAGVYEVRYQAKANYDVSSVTEITVAAGRKLVVALPTNQQGYTLTATATELDWHGSATLTVSIDSAYFAGKGYAVKVDGKAIELSDKGTYELKDVEGDVNVTVEGVLKHEPDGTGWAHDAKNHWHVCRCGDIIDKAEHTFEWVVDWPATVEAKGEKHQECTVCHEKGKTEEIAILVPEIIDGKGQTMVVDAAKDLSFRSSAPLAFFQKVLVDDKEVAAENYVLTEGSTIVTLKASFLNTLGVGEHRLSVVSTTGTAETTFTVAEAAKPAPGQTTTTTTSKPKKRASKEALPESGDSTYVVAGAVLAAGVAVLLLAWAIMKRRA